MNQNFPMCLAHCNTVAVIVWYNGLVVIYFLNSFIFGICHISLSPPSNLSGYMKLFCAIIWANKHVEENQYKC